MSTHTGISVLELADRLAIRELIETYARCADRRDEKGWMALFASDAHFAVYMNGRDATPSPELHSRDALGPIFAHFTQYDSTTHFVGQSTLFTLSNDRATGEAYVLAHHITLNAAGRQLNLASIRYNDSFVKVDDV
jgi:SnoaL-like domain